MAKCRPFSPSGMKSTMRCGMNQSNFSNSVASSRACAALFTAAFLIALATAAIATGWLMCRMNQGRLQLRSSRWLPLSVANTTGSGTRHVRSEDVKKHLHMAPAQWTFPGASNCTGEINNTALCQWCNATFLQQYPLSPEMLERSYIPGSPCSMPSNLLDMLRSGAPVKLAVIGGSMTMGTHCFDSERPELSKMTVSPLFYKSTTCPWMYKMQKRLQQLFPAANISIANHARGGFSYGEHLSLGTLKAATDADVLFIDMQVNSQVRS